MAEDPIKAVCHFAQALKAPRIRESAARLAEQARDGGWSHEEYLAAVLSREVAAREASGAAIRIRSAGFPTRKSLEDFNFDHQVSLSAGELANKEASTTSLHKICIVQSVKESAYFTKTVQVACFTHIQLRRVGSIC